MLAFKAAAASRVYDAVAPPIALGAGVSVRASGPSSHRRPILGPVAQLVRAHA